MSLITDNQVAVPLAAVVDHDELVAAVRDRLVAVKAHPDGNRYLLNYTEQAQFARAWTTTIRACRGLITLGHPLEDPDAVVLARPFAKFGNLNEYGPESALGTLPLHRPFQVYEKVDGSLAIPYRDETDRVAFATRGSFQSDQALAATQLWRARYADVELPRTATVLFEYVAPWNRVVVDYAHEDLVLLGAIDHATGADVDFDWAGPRATIYDGYQDVADITRYLLEHDTADAEGVVVRFVPEDPATPSVRTKMKFAEYQRVHRLATGISSLSVWESLRAGDSLDELYERAPDEAYDFVRTLVNELTARHAAYVETAARLAEPLYGMIRRDAAAIVTAQREVPAHLVFAALDGKDVSAMAWQILRPEYETPRHRPTP